MGGKKDIVADYYDIFNNEVKQFLQPGFDYELESSRIHADSKVRSLEDPEEDEDGKSNEEDDESELSSAESESIAGSNGGSDGCDNDEDRDGSDYEDHDENSSSESDSRYVTADESAGEEDIDSKESKSFSLGTYWSSREKSVFFHCLSRYSIHRLDEWHSKLPSKAKFEILLYYKVLKYNLRELQRRNLVGGLVSNEDFPIAYEMDEFYVELEEFMSRQVRIEYEKPIDSNSADDPSGNEEDDEHLLSIDNWNKRWQAIYCKSGIDELKPLSSEPLPYSKETFQFLTDCAKAYTRRLLWFTVLQEMDKLSIAKKMLFPREQSFKDDDLVLHASDEQLPHVVTQSSVLKAISTLKQEGFNTPTIPETVLHTLEKFKVEPVPEGKLFKNQQVTQSLLPSLFKQGAADSAAFYLSDFHDSPHIKPESDPIHKKLYTIHNGKKRRIDDTFVRDDPFDSIDNPLEIDICDWEAQLLETRDTRLSKLHQHMLLSYYNSVRNQTYFQLDSESPDQAQEPFPVEKFPSTLLNLFMHSNS